MRGDWSGDADRRTIFVERYDDFPRMQMQHWSVFARCGPIDRVTEDGPTHRGTVDAKLMRASGQRFECEPAKGLTRPLQGRAADLCSQSERRRGGVG